MPLHPEKPSKTIEKPWFFKVLADFHFIHILHSWTLSVTPFWLKTGSVDLFWRSKGTQWCPVGSQGASWEVIRVVRERLFIPLFELWFLLMHLCGSLDGPGQPSLVISGSLGLIFIHFGPHFEYFCMRKKANRITSTLQADQRNPIKSKAHANSFFSKKRELNGQQLLRRPSNPEKDWTSRSKLNSIHPSIHSFIHSSIQPSIKRVH